MAPRADLAGGVVAGCRLELYDPEASMSLLLASFFACKDAPRVDSEDSAVGLPDCEEAQLVDFFQDADGDGYGDPDKPLGRACEAPAGGVREAGDCDDGDAAVNPGAEELCDDLDNDCDGRIDEEGAERSWYADGDGDGYGRDEDVVGSCERMEGWAEVGGDCEDGDPAVHPGVEELCDGLDNDCDAGTDEAGTASFDAGDGALQDLTAQLVGSQGAPAELRLEQAGELHFCPGTFYVNLELAADLVLSAEEGVVLDGGGVGPVLRSSQGGLSLLVSDLELQGGVGGAQVAEFGDVGGGLACTGDGSTVSLVRVDVHDNSGGGVAAEGCAVSLQDSVVRDNVGGTGAGILVASAPLSLVDSRVSGNQASQDGGGVALVGSSEGTLTGTLVTGNRAGRGAGLWIGDASELTCTGDDQTAAGSVANEASESGGGAEIETAGGVLRSVACDWGTAEGADDSSPQDVHVLEHAYWMEDDATFICENGSCGGSTAYTFGSSWSSMSSGDIVGNTLEATGTGSIDAFSLVADLSGCSSVDWAVATGNGSAGTWTIVWSSLGASGLSGTNSSGPVGITTTSGTWYALLVHPHDCQVRYGADFPTGVDVGVGKIRDYFVADPAGSQGLSGSSVELAPGRHDRSMLLYGGATTTSI